MHQKVPDRQRETVSWGNELLRIKHACIGSTTETDERFKASSSRIYLYSRSFVIQRSSHDSGLEVLHTATGIDSQEILDFILFHDLSRWPRRSKGPIRRRGQHNVTVLLSGRDDTQVALCRWRLGDGGKFADDLVINDQFLGSSFVGYPRATKLQGVIVPVVNDLEFTPEDTVDSGPIFHTGHIEFVGRHNSVQGNMLAFGQLQVESRGHFENGGRAIDNRSSVLISFETCK